MSIAYVLVEAEEGHFGEDVFSGEGLEGLMDDVARVYDGEAKSAAERMADDDALFYHEMNESMRKMLETSKLIMATVDFVGYEQIEPIRPHWHPWMLVAVKIDGS